MQDASMCGAAGGAHPLVVPVEKLGPLLLLLPRLPVLVLCHLLSLLLIPPLLVEPADLLHRLVGLSYCSNVPLLAAWLGGCVKMGMGTCSLCSWRSTPVGLEAPHALLTLRGLVVHQVEAVLLQGQAPHSYHCPPKMPGRCAAEAEHFSYSRELVRTSSL